MKSAKNNFIRRETSHLYKEKPHLIKNFYFKRKKYPFSGAGLAKYLISIDYFGENLNEKLGFLAYFTDF
jgi:CTP-dependent riboflavin kinase